MLKTQIQEIFKQHNLSVTKNRIQIITCLEDGLSFHTIQDISQHLKLNTKSIYNNIKRLEEHGLIDSFSFGGISKYALCKNLTKDNDEIIHIVNDQTITGLKIDSQVFVNIKKEIESHGWHPKHVRIFVEVTIPNPQKVGKN